jgi:hypothetical protein
MFDMNKNNYEVNVIVNGRPVREYYHNGQFYIEARENYEYSIKLKNHSHKKIMAVLSVDGIDVLKGKSATDAESGYIINPYSSTEIKGYRIDDECGHKLTTVRNPILHKSNKNSIERGRKEFVGIAPSKIMALLASI